MLVLDTDDIKTATGSLTSANALRALPAPGARSPWTEKERRLIDLIHEGDTAKDAARKLGIRRRELSAFLARDDVREELANMRQGEILASLTPKALGAMADILEDEEASAAVRAKLAVSIVGLSEKISEADRAKDEGLRSLDAMSAAELIDMAARMRDELATQRNAIDATFSPIDSENPLF